MIHYWSHEGYEIDFVVVIGKDVFAIEVKSGRKKLAKSLDVFKRQFPKSKSVFITKENFTDFCKHPKEWLQMYSI